MCVDALTNVPLVDQYLSIRLDTDLTQIPPGETVVVETPRRLTREVSYGSVRAMWYLSLADGRRVISVPPGAGPAVKELATRIRCDELPDSTMIDELSRHIDRALRQAGLPQTNTAFSDLVSACTAGTLIRHSGGDCRHLRDTSIPPTDGLTLPEHCFPDGLVYGVVVDGHVASVAYAHRTHLMEDQIVDVGIETAPDCRRHGYAKTALSALTAHITDLGGEGIYSCSPENTASIHTARSAGYIHFGSSVILSAPCMD